MVLITAYIHLVTRDNKLLHPDASLDILQVAATEGDAFIRLDFLLRDDFSEGF